jgi:imidazole glycerol phosphate synthase subunit HisF
LALQIFASHRLLIHRSGADKISIGGDAVDAAEDYYASGKKLTGQTAIEQISQVYGKQAVVVGGTGIAQCKDC